MLPKCGRTAQIYENQPFIYRLRADIFFEYGFELLAKLGNLRRDDGRAIWILVAVEVEIILMIIFGGIIRRQGRNLCNNGGIKPFFGFNDGGLRVFLLGFVVVENDGAILRTFVGSLSVEGGGVVGLEEDFQKLGVANLFGVEVNADNFGVSRRACADFFISWVFDCAACVARFYFAHAIEVLKDGFGTPKTAAAKRGDARCFIVHFF